MRLQTLQCHPLDRKLDSALVVDTVIFFIIDVSGQAEVGHLHGVAFIQPVRKKNNDFLVLNSTLCFICVTTNSYSL